MIAVLPAIVSVPPGWIVVVLTADAAGTPIVPAVQVRCPATSTSPGVTLVLSVTLDVAGMQTASPANGTRFRSHLAASVQVPVTPAS